MMTKDVGGDRNGDGGGSPMLEKMGPLFLGASLKSN